MGGELLVRPCGGWLKPVPLSQLKRSRILSNVASLGSPWLKSGKTARSRLRLSNCNTLPSRDGNGADFHHELLELEGGRYGRHAK